MNTEVKINVTEIQRYCMHDGPSIRTTVFFKGCPLRCVWCHNPETQQRKSELLFYQTKCLACKSCELVCTHGVHTVGDEHMLDRERCIRCFGCTENCPTGALEKCGREMTVGEILAVVRKDAAFYGNDGGITLSGGEPFMQKEAAAALLEACREAGIHTAVETCGYADSDVLIAALPYVDLFLWDIKDTDDERHRRCTGVSNRRILDNLAMIAEKGARIRLRCILVAGVNTESAHYEKLAAIASGIPNCDGVELIPYHAYGGTKATFLGRRDNGDAALIPTAEQIESARNILTSCGAAVYGCR